MQSRQTLRSLPRIWLMTDERFQDALLPAIASLPRGSGVVFRQYSLIESDRRALFRQVKRICQRRDHILLLAGEALLARRWGADGFHGRHRNLGGLIHSMAVHNWDELRAAKQLGADLLFISPIHPTKSHPDAATLGIDGFRKLAVRARRAKAIALGGMDAERAKELSPIAYGWAGIDAFRI